MIRCTCGNRSYVVWTGRTEDELIVRRRRCDGCERRWYTIQRPEIKVGSFALTLPRRKPVRLRVEFLTLEQRQQILGSQDKNRGESIRVSTRTAEDDLAGTGPV
jgi:hypothetical protein